MANFSGCVHLLFFRTTPLDTRQPLTHCAVITFRISLWKILMSLFSS